MERVCKKCLLCFPESEFYKKKKLSAKGGVQYQSYCKSCHKKLSLEIYHNQTPETKTRWNKTRYKFDDKKRRNLLYKYGLTLNEYQEMLDNQDYKCYICQIEILDGYEGSGKKTNIARVDHCHATGKVRKLLCHHCNALLGYAKENPEILKKSIRYLEEHDSL